MSDDYTYDDSFSQIDYIDFDILSNSTIKKMSALGDGPGVEIADLYENAEPKKSGLIDPRLGTCSMDINCATCGLNTNYCVGHFGHIDLAETVFHIGYFPYVHAILTCICPRCSELLIYKNEDEVKDLLKSKSGKERMSYIRALSKSVTHCQGPKGCGSQIPKIKMEKKKTSATINIVAETDIEGKDDVEGKRKIRQILSADIIYDILKNIKDDNCRILGIDPLKSRPEDMVHKVFPVPPVQMRPSARGDFNNGASTEDDLTHKLADIVKANTRIYKNKESQNDANVKKYSNEHTHLLQYHVATYIDNDAMGLLKTEQKGKPFKSLGARLKGKTGRVRGNLMGKRGDFAARTVITSDPSISYNQLGVPVKIAMSLTFPEVVTPYNIEVLKKLVRSGRDVYPGANFVFPMSKQSHGKKVLPIDLRYRKEDIELNYGDIVERHLQNNDIVLLNRQPTLHKQSMMGHRIKVINNPELLTYRLSVAVTIPYNADFDGDEMNIFLPQSIQTQIELEEIACVEKQIITPTTSKTIIGIVQDGLIGAYNLTSPTVTIDWRSAMNIMSYLSIDFASIKKNTDYTGSELYSLIIPSDINVTKNSIKIKNGKILEGRLTEEHLGAKKKNNLIQLIWDGYGVDETRTFIDNTQRLVNNFNLWHGFTVGMKDTEVPNEIHEEISKMFETIEIKINHFITEMENNPDFMLPDLYELKLYSELNSLRDNTVKLITNVMKIDNGFKIMETSGSKGSGINIAQIMGCLGLQLFEGKIMPKKYNNRTLAYFHQNDDRGVSRGLVRESFMSGLEFPSFVYHLCGARLGLIESAIKSVTGDTSIIIKENGFTKRVLIGEWIDNHLNENKDDIKHYKEKQMELLDLNNETYIPTTDEHGHVSWEIIKAVTRHDSGNELYEFKTIGGRKVIVVQSKSLLIWNDKLEIFEQVLTKDIKIGDFMPVTMNLPYVNQKSICEYAHKYTREDGILIGKNLIKCNKYIPDEAFSAPEEFIIGILEGYTKNTGLLEIISNTIYIYVDSERLLEGINILCSILGIFGIFYDDKTYTIVNNWAQIFINKLEIRTTNFNQNNETYIHIHKIHNDVVLDKIISIEKVDATKYPKVYDLTVPKTLNFGLANGLQVADTAETGYIQRKLIKSMEDIMVKYDGTVRSASDGMIQLVYGDTGVDTTKQYDYNIKLLEMGNDDIKTKYVFEESELKQIKNFSSEDNEKLYEDLLKMRDLVRKSVRNARRTYITYITFETNFMIPINLNRIINSEMGKNTSSKNGLDPNYIISKINELLSNEFTTIIYMSKEEKNNLNSFKNRDEILHKTVLKTALYDALNPKKVILDMKMSKVQFDNIIKSISYNFNKNMVEPGEMAGIIAAQSTGEPLTQMTLKSFHHAGIASMSAKTQGVPRMRELLSVTKKAKSPQMVIYINEEFSNNKDMVHKIGAHIKYTTFGDIRKRINFYYDANSTSKDSIMTKDNVEHVFYQHKGVRSGCSTEIKGLPWLIRVELDREKMLKNEISLLDIKSKFCNWWEKRFADTKTMSKEEKRVLNKITQMAVLSNTDNDKQPVIYIRFNVKDADKEKDIFGISTINDFIDYVIDKFKLKGINSISDMVIDEKRLLVFNKETGNIDKKQEQVIYASGVNLNDIRYITGIDLTRTMTNNVVEMYNTFGIEIARSILLNEIYEAYKSAGGEVNYQHIEITADQMTTTGKINSIDRFGMNKSDNDPLSRASFEKTVEQLLIAAVHGETDHMRGVSSRIMVGSIIKGGTGYCELELDTDMIEKSEYIEGFDIEKQVEIDKNTLANDIIKRNDDNVFIPE